MGKKTKFVLEMIAVAIIIWILTVIVFTDQVSFRQAGDAEEVVTMPEGDLTDGTYTGQADGHNGPLEVQVVVENGEITAVDVLDHVETEGISDPALAEVPAAIVENNSTDVDTVSGATVSSEAIITAVNNALSGSAGDTTSETTEGEETAALVDGTYTGEAEGHNGPLTVEVTVTDGVIANVAVTDHVETEGISDPAIEEIPAAIVENNSTEVDLVSGASVTSGAIIEAVNNALSSEATQATSTEEVAEEDGETVVVEAPSSLPAIVGYVFADGTYTGEAEGRHGPIEVEVTIEEGTIANVEVLNHVESEDIGVPAIEATTAAIVEQNSTDVEVVSGASLTSQGVMNATKNALGILVVTNDEPHLVFEDGTYTGEAEGFGGPIRVEVIVAEGKISEVTILEHGETQGISDPAIEEIPAAIINQNKVNVSAVSGASYTSLGIVNAVSNALNLPELTQEDLGSATVTTQVATTEEAVEESEEVSEEEAAEESESEEVSEEVVWQDGTYTAETEGHNGPLEVEVTIEEGAITAVEVLNHEETEGISDPAIEEVPAAIVEANSTEVDIVSGASVSSQAIIDAVNLALEEAAGGSSETTFEDGTHTGSAEGHNGPLELEVVVEDGAIVEINILDHSETKGLSDPAFEEVVAAIIESNSVEVDTVSGATYTSNAIIDAVKNALNIEE
ncbi:FMN-binding protein [Fundicoccus culcitae]|uniref:FMN-binding protein n=1 Tax=Fundicoccus culcitae TaxID=2969821 RepID=A0ABY5P8Q9_9LACT|nr:FMN-binding protein [Fundicoccus culcitae]UUX34966.1 FMN-binding protein [Fundicoccus culcitae]